MPASAHSRFQRLPLQEPRLPPGRDYGSRTRPGTGSFQPLVDAAFRIDQEGAVDNHPLSRFEPAQDLRPSRASPTGLHRARLETTIAAFDKHAWIDAGFDDRFRGNS